ncbi:terminase small subunit [Laribacter hongkongensis]|uniref:terminase small subunit n=1 Tax=Laribacter hongkongensis TaxID=168471 RepID=UPI001EFE4287|nr:terminase small subunit [Laribacter hongkongensis]
MKKLTPKQQWFVDEYLIDLNATQAAIRGGRQCQDGEPYRARATCKNLYCSSHRRTHGQARKAHRMRRQTDLTRRTPGAARMLRNAQVQAAIQERQQHT